MGRGSIIIGEDKNSKAFVKNSSFIGNYAYYGGVFFVK
jgi:hypothetical protein